MNKSYNIEWWKTDAKKYILCYIYLYYINIYNIYIIYLYTFQKQVKLICSQDIGQPWKGVLLEGARVGSGMLLIFCLLVRELITQVCSRCGNSLIYTFIYFFFRLFFLIFIYLFIYGCVGSSFLCEGFL